MVRTAGSQSIVETGLKEPADSLKETQQTKSCVSTFTNQTISSLISVIGCSTLTVQNITVTNTGALFLIAPSDVTINGAFDVLLGGALNVQCEAAPIQSGSYTYTYDAAGNRISRNMMSTMSAKETDDDNKSNTLMESLEGIVKESEFEK